MTLLREEGEGEGEGGGGGGRRGGRIEGGGRGEVKISSNLYFTCLLAACVCLPV